VSESDQALANSLEQLLAKEGIAPESCADLVRAFALPFTQATALIADAQKIVVTDEKQTAAMKEAGIQRKAIKNVRTTAENTRKVLKEDSLKRGQSIDKVARMVREMCEREEARLEACEKFAEIAEAKRRDERAIDRANQLRPYTDPGIYTDLGGMSEETFALALSGAKDAHTARTEREAREAEEKAAAERARQQELAAARAEAQAKAEEARQARAEADRVEKEAREAAKAAEAERDAARQQARQAAEARQRAEERTKNQEASRRLEEQERNHQRMAAESAPDGLKLIAWAAAIDAIQPPNMTTKAGAEAASAFVVRLIGIAELMREHARTLG